MKSAFQNGGMIGSVMNFRSFDRYFVNDVTEVIIGGTVGENGTLNLSTPGGQTFTRVAFASYGNAGGTSPNFTLGGCNASNSVSIVESYALGQSSVSIPATNGVFGDPCPGTPKSLSVALAYNVDNSGFRNYKDSGIWSLRTPSLTAGPLYSPRTSNLLVQSATSYTFNNIDIGRPTTDRLVVIGVTVQGGTFSSGSISGLTIGGVSATQAVQSPTNDTFTRTAFFYSPVTTGETANIVVTLSAGSGARCFITPYALYGLSSNTPFSTNTNAASSTSITNTINTSVGSIVIALGSVNALTTMNWTNVNQDFTAQDVRTMTGASIQTTTSGNRTITLQQNSGGNQTMQLATAVWV